jgi:DNA-binding PadR family transcriptional regulator
LRSKLDNPSNLRSPHPLTPAVFFVLFALADGQRHGYAIMQQTSKLSEGSLRMGPATLYTTIQRLLHLAAIEEVSGPSRATDREARRRYYRLTRSGMALLNAEIRRMKSVVHRAAEMKLAPNAAG